MKKSTITLIAILVAFSSVESKCWRPAPRTETAWVGKTTQNYAIILENGTLFVIRPDSKSRLFIVGDGPCNGIGYWKYFADESGESHFCSEGVFVNLTNRPLKGRCQKRSYVRPNGEIPPFDEPNEAYEGGNRGNAQLPSMDDDFPYVAF
jgi:hypothetical protein